MNAFARMGIAVVVFLIVGIATYLFSGGKPETFEAAARLPAIAGVLAWFVVGWIKKKKA